MIEKEKPLGAAQNARVVRRRIAFNYFAWLEPLWAKSVPTEMEQSGLRPWVVHSEASVRKPYKLV